MDEHERDHRFAVYPGSFDPITNGHLDLIRRALAVFDSLTVAVAQNPNKKPLFTVEERVDMIRRCVGEDPRVKVDQFSGLLVDYCRKTNARTIIRGLRALSDFEYEFQLALINRKLDRTIDTIFMMTGFQWFYVNSSIVKEAASLGGSIKGMVPVYVAEKLRAKFERKLEEGGAEHEGR
ncbi:MAG: pantetheine-phosphate adenylyltransferase [Deltaproteobacteria bacterium]|nr:pantetheine-phosphate adenylyltransferase [Deltaproteobacteria bacterium]MBW2306324.1 pantetheine-phosphate adenylyltransferase [Deltaproteobacteria bacterium]